MREIINVNLTKADLFNAIPCSVKFKEAAEENFKGVLIGYGIVGADNESGPNISIMKVADKETGDITFFSGKSKNIENRLFDLHAFQMGNGDDVIIEFVNKKVGRGTAPTFIIIL